MVQRGQDLVFGGRLLSPFARWIASKKRRSIMLKRFVPAAALLIGASAAIALTAGPALAAPGHGGGGFHGGGFHGGGFHGGGFHGGGFHGGFSPGFSHVYHNSFYGYRGYPGYRHFYGYGGYFGYPYFYGGYYPFYDSYYPSDGGLISDSAPYAYSPNYSGATAPAYSGQSSYFEIPTTNSPPVISVAPATSSTSITSKAAAPIQLTVKVPADAQVWIDGTKTTSTGLVRRFKSPPVERGYRYSYAVRASWKENDQTITQTQTISVAPGAIAEADFPTQPVAAESGSRSTTH